METNRHKQELIEALDLISLSDLMYQLLGRSGYDQIEKPRNQLLIVKTESPKGPAQFHFYLTTERLHAEGELAEETLNDVNVLRREFPGGDWTLVSSKNITQGFRKKIQGYSAVGELSFWDRDKVVELVDSRLINFWKRGDPRLLGYEQKFKDAAENQNDLKRLSIFSEKYQHLAEMFIEPTIFELEFDVEAKKPGKKIVNLQSIVNSKASGVISGEAGSGKTTLLKQIGLRLFAKNVKEESSRPFLPIFLFVLDLIDNAHDVEHAAKTELESKGWIGDWINVWNDYQVVFLIDTLDELDESHRVATLRRLVQLKEEKKVRYIIGTRNLEVLFSSQRGEELSVYWLSKFDTKQAEKFMDRFFRSDATKVKRLLEDLNENRILERMPMTPLSLTLISILSEEKQFETPATLTDVYDYFNDFILGKLTVKDRFEFLDINIRQRILSKYALELLERDEHRPMTRDEFINYFVEFFSNKSIKSDPGTLTDALSLIIDMTGILVVDEKRFVKFHNDSFLEYYAAIEIFSHQREKESQLISKFFNPSWQNAAVFYAGKSKDMPAFLRDVIEHCEKANNIREYFSAVPGIGYLVQALYMTDKRVRMDGIRKSLDLNIKGYDIMKQVASENHFLFQKWSFPILGAISSFIFYESFDSITLKEPLLEIFVSQKQSLDTEELHESEVARIHFSLIQLALTLSSGRLGLDGPAEELMEMKPLLQNPFNLVLMNLVLFNVANQGLKAAMKTEIKNQIAKFPDGVIRQLMLPAKRNRFTKFDQLYGETRVKLFVEGKTDADIIEHAYKVLTGRNPYWQIRAVGNGAGGATEVAKVLMTSASHIEDGQIFVGIFDNDAKGIQEFKGGLRDSAFAAFENSLRVKKHLTATIYGLKLPIPSFRGNYLQEKDSFNFFEIEHYFDDEFLNQHHMLKATPIDGVFEIRGSKASFSREVLSINEVRLFQSFVHLFWEIDKLCGMEDKIEYFVSEVFINRGTNS